MSKKETLYLSLTGMGDDLGKSQVLEYLYGLKDSYNISLISYERDMSIIPEIRKEIDGRIEWYPLKYSNKYGPLSTLKCLFQGYRLANKIIRNKKVQLIHSRSMIPSMIGVRMSKKFNIPHIFDIRGFATEEKVDRGRIKKNSLTYRVLNKQESVIYNNSAHIVTLTHKAKDILLDQFPRVTKDQITVIPTCASSEVFKRVDPKEIPLLREKLGLSQDKTIFIHTGNVGTWYDFDKEVLFFKKVLENNPNALFLLLNKGQHAFIQETFAKHEIASSNYEIREAKFTDVYKYLNLSDYSLFFIKPSFSKQASAPTKFAENVRCHLPTISNKDVGDMEFYLTKYRVGASLSLANFDQEYEGLAKSIAVGNHLYNDGQYDQLFSEHFNKGIAIEKYLNIYNQLTN